MKDTAGMSPSEGRTPLTVPDKPSVLWMEASASRPPLTSRADHSPIGTGGRKKCGCSNPSMTRVAPKLRAVVPHLSLTILPIGFDLRRSLPGPFPLTASR